MPIDDQARQYDQRDTSTCSCGHKPRPGGGSILEVQFCQQVDRVGNYRAVFETLSCLPGLDSGAEGKVRVHCLALGGADLTSPAGKMTMAVISAVAEFERDLLVERTRAGLDRAKAQGKKLGRPSLLTDDQQHEVRLKRAEGLSLAALAKEFGVSRSAIHRIEPA